MRRPPPAWLWLLLAAGVALVSTTKPARELVALSADELARLPQRVASRLSRLGAGWTNLDPEFRRRALAVLEEANRLFGPRGLAVGLHTGWRSLEAQREVMARGASRLSDPLSSYHVWGLAGDFVFIDRAGRWTWLPRADRKLDRRWLELGAIFRRHGLVWGADWDSDGNLAEHLLVDAPHAQLPLLKVAQLRARYGEPATYIASRASAAVPA